MLLASLNVQQETQVKSNLNVKFVFDIVLACISLLIFSPLMLLISIILLLGSKGPVFFKQERVGYKGKLFTLYKFRTMIVNAEANNIPQLCQGSSDSRLTKVGRFLRNYHLDELPQLWNVLKGEMSFVGPRPERQYFVDQILSITPQYKLLYQLRPGLFSEATLYNGYTDNMEKMLTRLRMDLNYLLNRSLILDLKIIFLTAFSIIIGNKF